MLGAYPDVSSSLPLETGLKLSQYDLMVNHPRPGDNLDAFRQEDIGESEHAVDECVLDEVIVPVPAATTVELECKFSRLRSC